MRSTVKERDLLTGVPPLSLTVPPFTSATWVCEQLHLNAMLLNRCQIEAMGTPRDYVVTHHGRERCFLTPAGNSPAVRLLQTAD